MMQENLRRMMQEQLDGLLEEDKVSELFAHLDRDEDAAEEYARLQQVDTLLARAPHARAPHRLAATIMARLANSVQHEAELQALPLEVQQAFQLSLSLVMLSMMPMMVAASWLVLNARANPLLLTRVVERVVALQVMMLDALVFLLKEVEELVERNPEKASIAFSLIPIILMGILDSIQGADSDDHNGNGDGYSL
jgi:hypothetical protein